MKVAFPVQENNGMDSHVFGHFGSAPQFIITDSEKGGIEVSENPDKVHQHGQCQPLAALSGRTVDAVVVGGIGVGALNKLNSAGIAIYRAVEGTVAENHELLKSGVLPLFTLEHTCAGHGLHGPCSH